MTPCKKPYPNSYLRHLNLQALSMLHRTTFLRWPMAQARHPCHYFINLLRFNASKASYTHMKYILFQYILYPRLRENRAYYRLPDRRPTSSAKGCTPALCRLTIPFKHQGVLFTTTGYMGPHRCSAPRTSSWWSAPVRAQATTARSQSSKTAAAAFAPLTLSGVASWISNLRSKADSCRRDIR